MATPTRIEGDVYVAGSLAAATMTIPASAVTNAAIQANAAIAYTKLVPLTPITVELFGPAVTVAAATRLVHIARAAGTLVAMEAITEVQATGADRTIAVDLKKSTGAAAYSTVLTTPCNFTNASAVRTPVAAVINTAAYIDGDSFTISVAVAGSASAQATGLAVTLWFAESPQ